jgi:hypothetical protein
MEKRPVGIRADRGYSYRDLEHIASRVRKQLALPPTTAINAQELFDGLDLSVRDRNGRSIPVRGGVIEIKDSEGYSRYDSDQEVIEILASAATYAWLEQGHPRAVYFVSHELGHCLLHTNLLVRLAQMPSGQQAALHRGGERSTHKFFRDTEWQANAFAGALLMPARGLVALEQKHSDGLFPEEIAEHFQVSVQAATYRLQTYNDRKDQIL